MVDRGDVWIANLNPTQGSEQAGIRPVLIFQNSAINAYTTTVVAIPLTTNLRCASLPSSVRLRQGEAGLAKDSVVLCHQVQVIDKARLQPKLGAVTDQTIAAVEGAILFTLGIV
jgi:mRNA interferase MazF